MNGKGDAACHRFSSSLGAALRKRPPVVSLMDCSVSFGGLPVIRNVTLNIYAGEFVSILGPSGCGKSTLLRLIAGIIPPSGGKVQRLGAEMGRESGPNMAFVFQKPVLMPWLTALQNVQLPLSIGGKKVYAERLRLDKALDALELVGLRDFAYHYPHQLSGGMQQRVSIARALAADPKVLLMDEPFSALDELTRETMNLEILRIWKDLNASLETIVMVTHSIPEAVFMSNRIVLMSSRPTTVQRIYEVPLPFPRIPEVQEYPEYLEMVRQLREAVKGQ